jgi:predicted SprT family Zn-dependent metalloprotease
MSSKGETREYPCPICSKKVVGKRRPIWDDEQLIYYCGDCEDHAVIHAAFFRETGGVYRIWEQVIW